MEYGEEVHKVSEMELNLGADFQGVGVGIKSLGGTKTPGVEGETREDETSEVTPKGYRVSVRDG